MSTFVPTFPLYPTLANAVTKTRKLTGSSNAFQVTDSYIVQQMHSFYSYDLPAKFRSLKLKDIYTFTTNVGINSHDSCHTIPCAKYGNYPSYLVRIL